ncbi:hypothetical protein BTVI_15267 [Pitangus sulphuratus]|nr:hypothetical protein BTVI_15267 [Pitangus sulphuratus]
MEKSNKDHAIIITCTIRIKMSSRHAKKAEISVGISGETDYIQLKYLTPPTVTIQSSLELTDNVLFNIFISDMEDGIKCTLTEFASDAKLSGEVDSSEGRATLQEDLDGLEDKGRARGVLSLASSTCQESSKGQEVFSSVPEDPYFQHRYKQHPHMPSTCAFGSNLILASHIQADSRRSFLLSEGFLVHPHDQPFIVDPSAERSKMVLWTNITFHIIIEDEKHQLQAAS